MNPVAKKLLIKPDSKWLILNSQVNHEELLDPLPENAMVSVQASGKFDGILLFVRSKAELVKDMIVIAQLLTPQTIFWISYPKKSSGIVSDLKMGDWDELNQYHLQGVASLAVNDTWAGSRFRPIGQAKKTGMACSDIKNNDFAAYIDVENKTIKLPPDLKQALEHNPKALANYEVLSYSNRKEYVLWILTAKQKHTREDRIVKVVDKLIAGKKSPFEK